MAAGSTGARPCRSPDKQAPAKAGSPVPLGRRHAVTGEMLPAGAPHHSSKRAPRQGVTDATPACFRPSPRWMSSFLMTGESPFAPRPRGAICWKSSKTAMDAHRPSLQARSPSNTGTRPSAIPLPWQNVSSWIAVDRERFRHRRHPTRHRAGRQGTTSDFSAHVRTAIHAAGQSPLLPPWPDQAGARDSISGLLGQ